MSFSKGAQGDPTTSAAAGRQGIGSARLLTAILSLCAVFVVWREFEPSLLFRPADGVVVWSEVERWEQRIRRRSHAVHAAQVGYRYEVDGRSFQSWQYQRTIISGSRSAAAARARGYTIGARVPAWYSPFNPSDSVLSREPNWSLLAFIGFAGLLVWRAWQPRRRASGAPQ